MRRLNGIQSSFLCLLKLNDQHFIAHLLSLPADEFSRATIITGTDFEKNVILFHRLPPSIQISDIEHYIGNIINIIKNGKLVQLILKSNLFINYFT